MKSVAAIRIRRSKKDWKQLCKNVNDTMNDRRYEIRYKLDSTAGSLVVVADFLRLNQSVVI